VTASGPVPVDLVRTRAEAALKRVGVPGPQAALQADLLIEAELRGRASHGLMRLPRIVSRILNGVAHPTESGAHRWRGSMLDVDGLKGLGPVVAMSALRTLEAKAIADGVALAAISNSNHIGMLAYYAEAAASHGFVAIVLSTSEALVHPWGGSRALLGTNPIAIGCPTSEAPFVMDMATGLVSMGQIHDYAARGAPLPSGWALDADGAPTTDADAAKSGAIAPFGGAKGYALSLALEVLVTALTGAAIGRAVEGTLDEDRVCNKGDVFLVARPRSTAGLTERITAFLHEVRASAKPHGAVLIPGDRALVERAQRLRLGLPLPGPLWDRIQALADTDRETAQCSV
jgi:L-2-hydroxycarboxylate dehydrogenase (NAD+)